MDEDIKKAEEKIEYLSSDPKTIELYKAREKSLHERANMISSAKEEGIEKGIEIGVIKVAKNLFRKGMDVREVAEAAEITIEKAREIKRDIDQQH